MKELFVWLTISLASVFCLIASIGILRFRDLYMRIHAATKAGAFGGSLAAIAAGIHFNTLSAWIHAILIIIFFYATTPVAAHLLSKQYYTKDKKGH